MAVSSSTLFVFVIEHLQRVDASILCLSLSKDISRRSSSKTKDFHRLQLPRYLTIFGHKIQSIKEVLPSCLISKVFAMDSSNIKMPNDAVTEDLVSIDAEKRASSRDEKPEEPQQTKFLNTRKVKAEAIRRACDSRDIEALVSHATTEGGLLEDELRQRACKERRSTVTFRVPRITSSIQGPFFCSVTKERHMMT